MTTEARVRIVGLDDLRRDLKAMDKNLPRELAKESKELVSIVKDRVEARAERYGTEVAGGVRARSRGASSFVDSRNKKSSVEALRRPLFSDLYYDTAFEPAADESEDEVMRGYEEMVERWKNRYGF